jgi:hypothetical protein
LRELANFYRLSDIKIKRLRLAVGVEPGGVARGLASRNKARAARFKQGETPYDEAASLRVRAGIGDVIPQAFARVGNIRAGLRPRRRFQKEGLNFLHAFSIVLVPLVGRDFYDRAVRSR